MFVFRLAGIKGGQEEWLCCVLLLCINGSFVAIIGAGPAGLAVAAQLLERRVPFVVIERNAAAGSSWRSRYHRLHLHTVPAASALPFWSFPSHFPKYVSAADLAAYYDGYARTLLGDHVLYDATVTSADPDAATGGWRVTVLLGGQEQELAASAVVVATGQEGAPHIPAIMGAADFGGEVIHSSAWQGAERYRGKRALVVGFGNSGAEIALDLWEHGAAAVTVAVRSPINLMPRWFMEVYPHGHGLLRLLERFCTPPWLSDALATYVFYPLLYPDLGSLSLRLSTKGIKTSLVQDHSPPLLDIGAIELIRKRQVHVQQGQRPSATPATAASAPLPSNTTLWSLPRATQRPATRRPTRSSSPRPASRCSSQRTARSRAGPGPSCLACGSPASRITSAACSRSAGRRP